MHTQLLRKFVVQLLGVNASIHDAAAALQTIERLADHNGWFGGTRESCEKLMKYPPKIPVNEEPRVTSPLESIDGEQQSILQRHCPPVKNIPSACKHPNSTNGNFGGYTRWGFQPERHSRQTGRPDRQSNAKREDHYDNPIQTPTATLRQTQQQP